MVAFFATWIFRATWFYSQVDLAIPVGVWRQVFSDGVKFVLWVLPAAAYVRWHDRQNPLATMKINTHLDRRGALIGGGASILYFACVIGYAYFTAHQLLASLSRAAPLAVVGTLASGFFSPVFEELLFRGFVLPKMNESLPFWPANLLQAALFAAIHWPNWVWVGGLHWSLVTTSISIFILAVLLGWLTWRTHSIWPAVAVHLVNNFLAAFLG
jgi:membrane protease YdiL (CAAX protease family)